MLFGGILAQGNGHEGLQDAGVRAAGQTALKLFTRDQAQLVRLLRRLSLGQLPWGLPSFPWGLPLKQ